MISRTINKKKRSRQIDDALPPTKKIKIMLSNERYDNNNSNYNDNDDNKEINDEIYNNKAQVYIENATLKARIEQLESENATLKSQIENLKYVSINGEPPRFYLLKDRETDVAKIIRNKELHWLKIKLNEEFCH